MSVILYDREEILAAIAATWNRGSIRSSDALRFMEYLAGAGNRIMEANLAAYNATYSDDAALLQVAITPTCIKRALIRDTMDAKLAGMRCLHGLRCNMIADNGRDFATAEVLDDLLGLMAAACDLGQARRSA